MPSRPDNGGDRPHLIRNVWRGLALVARVDRWLLVALIGCQLVDAGLAVAIAWVAKQLIDAVLAAIAHTGEARDAILWVLVELVLMVTTSAFAHVTAYFNIVLRSKLGLHVNRVILEKTTNVALWHFENAEFMESMMQARREASVRPLDLVLQCNAFLRNAVAFAGYAALLFSFRPWVTVVVFAVALPPFFAEARFGLLEYLEQHRRRAKNRKTQYIELAMTNELMAREVKLLSLGRWLLGRYDDIHMEFHQEEVALARRRMRAVMGLGLIEILVLYATYSLLVSEAIAGAITVGAMTMFITAFRQAQQSLRNALIAVARAHEDNLFMSNLFSYLLVPDDEPDLPLPEDDGSPLPPPSIEFKDVSFRYPGSDDFVLEGLSFRIERGQVIALLGRNGAGKTTLVKLLAGLYAPTSGTIEVDGCDVSQMTPVELRRRLSILLQDFGRFHFTARENVGMGWIPDIDRPGAIERAVRAADAGGVIGGLRQDLDTPLGRSFGGEELSGGQWQRVALARAFMRQGGALVLDEPTAAMDAHAEAEVFERLLAERGKRTTILITHRLASVRRADRIIVLGDGHVIEAGSHGDLMRRGGVYADMFRVQASGYLAGDTGSDAAA